MPPRKPRYATVKNPSIEAIIHRLYRFENVPQAVARIDELRRHFTSSRHQAPKTAQPSVILWIKGFEVTPEEEAQGITGNFALITYEVLEAEQKVTLYTHKLPAAPEHHPQKKRLKTVHPNWGHPILRAVKKRKSYPTKELAEAELARLHAEYPEASIPGIDKLFCMVYSGAKKGNPVQKYLFRVRPAPDGGFFIDFKINVPRKRTSAMPAKAKLEAATESAGESKGFFTNLVEDRRAKKKKK